ncbi:MAG: hypothetical protein QM766_09350 [Burkholderiaceae bacterium]
MARRPPARLTARLTARVALACAFALAGALPAAAQHPERSAAAAAIAATPDIAGIRLGMSEGEAMAVLQARYPQAKTRRVMRHFPYSDGARELSTPEYLWLIEAPLNANDVLSMQFSALPGPQRIVAIKRRSAWPGGADREALVQGLIAEFGTPTVVNSRTDSIAWAQPDRPACWRMTPRSTHFLSAGSGGDILDLIRRAQRAGVAPRDPSRCGYAVRASFQGRPVRRLTVSLSDLGAWAASVTRSQAWVAGLEAQARARRAERPRAEPPPASPPPEQVGGDPPL